MVVPLPASRNSVYSPSRVRGPAKRKEKPEKAARSYRRVFTSRLAIRKNISKSLWTHSKQGGRRYPTDTRAGLRLSLSAPYMM